MKGDVEMKHNELELNLLHFWKEQGFEWFYKYKNRVQLYRGDKKVPIELFYDLTNGELFSDIDDEANYSISEKINGGDIKVHIDVLLNNREHLKPN